MVHRHTKSNVGEYHKELVTCTMYRVSLRIVGRDLQEP